MINISAAIPAFLLLFCFATGMNAQITPRDAIKSMVRGINMGNTLEPPDGEGTWGNGPAQESNLGKTDRAGRVLHLAPEQVHPRGGHLCFGAPGFENRGRRPGAVKDRVHPRCL